MGFVMHFSVSQHLCNLKQQKIVYYEQILNPCSNSVAGLSKLLRSCRIVFLTDHSVSLGIRSDSTARIVALTYGLVIFCFNFHLLRKNNFEIQYTDI